MHALAQDRREPDRRDDLRDTRGRSSIDAGEEAQNARDRLVLVGTHAIGKIEDRVAPAPQRQRCAAPAHIAGVDRQQARDRLQQGGLARAVRTDQAEHFAGAHRQRDVGERRLLAIAFGHPGEVEQRLRSGGEGRGLGSVHAQSSRLASGCAELGRRPSDGEPAYPQAKELIRLRQNRKV
jgi:hypothetical protein